MDFFIATETLINSTLEETIHIECIALDINGFRISTCNQSYGLKGDGIALIHKKNLKVELVDKVMMNTSKYGLWSISTDSKMINGLGLYLPPLPERFQHPIRQSIKEFIDTFATLLDLDKSTNLIVCGNFIVHINDPDHDEARQLLDTMEVLIQKLPLHT